VSYDLCFWREQPALHLEPQAAYDALMEERDVEGLLPLPIEDYLTAVAEAFPAAVREPSTDLLVWQSEDQKQMFEVTWSPVHVGVSLRPLQPDNANRLIEIAANFGARLHDPQTGERFGAGPD
jgi:hypothetical protein